MLQENPYQSPTEPGEVHQLTKIAQDSRYNYIGSGTGVGVVAGLATGVMIPVIAGWLEKKFSHDEYWTAALVATIGGLVGGVLGSQFHQWFGRR